MTALGFLFISSFAAATLLPGGSEAILLGMLQQQSAAVPLLWLAATLGNSLGSMSSYLLGYWGRQFKPLPEGSSHYRRAMRWLEKYGYWSLLLAWLPLVGDLLCVLAGWSKFPPWRSCLLILIGKGARYAVLVWLFFSFA